MSLEDMRREAEFAACVEKGCKSSKTLQELAEEMKDVKDVQLRDIIPLLWGHKLVYANKETEMGSTLVGDSWKFDLLPHLPEKYLKAAVEEVEILRKGEFVIYIEPKKKDESGRLIWQHEEATLEEQFKHVEEQFQPYGRGKWRPRRWCGKSRLYTIRIRLLRPGDQLKEIDCDYFEKLVKLAKAENGFLYAYDSGDLPHYCTLNVRFRFTTPAQAKRAMRALAQQAFLDGVDCWFERVGERFWVTNKGYEANKEWQYSEEGKKCVYDVLEKEKESEETTNAAD